MRELRVCDCSYRTVIQEYVVFNLTALSHGVAPSKEEYIVLAGTDTVATIFRIASEYGIRVQNTLDL